MALLDAGRPSRVYGIPVAYRTRTTGGVGSFTGRLQQSTDTRGKVRENRVCSSGAGFSRRLTVPAVLYAIAQLERVRCRGNGVAAVERDEIRKKPDMSETLVLGRKFENGGHRNAPENFFLRTDETY